MIVRLLSGQDLEFLSLKGGCIGLSKSTLVKMPHCWKPHVKAHIHSAVVPNAEEVWSYRLVARI